MGKFIDHMQLTWMVFFNCLGFLCILQEEKQLVINAGINNKNLQNFEIM